MAGSLEQHQSEILYNDLRVELDHLSNEAKNKDYFRYLLEPESDYLTEACNEFYFSELLFPKEDFDAAKYHFETIEDVSEEKPTGTSIERSSSIWLILIISIPIIIAILVARVHMKNKRKNRNVDFIPTNLGFIIASIPSQVARLLYKNVCIIRKICFARVTIGVVNT